jgi:hypothetical protein
MKRFGISALGARYRQTRRPAFPDGPLRQPVNLPILPIGHPRQEAQRDGLPYQIITYERFLPQLLQLYSSLAGIRTLVLV